MAKVSNEELLKKIEELTKEVQTLQARLICYPVVRWEYVPQPYYPSYPYWTVTSSTSTSVNQ